jgi:hypothetical protein
MKIMESYLSLLNNIKIFIPGIHKTSYGYLEVWSQMDKFDLSGNLIGTQILKQILTKILKLDL